MISRKLYTIWSVLYEGEGGGDGAGAGDGAGDGGGAGDGAAAAGAGDGGAGDGKFTQEDVNRMLAEDRRKHKKNTQAALDELEALKSRSNLNKQEREELEGRIKTLNEQLLTKEELAAKDKTKMQTDFENQISGLTTERDEWKNRFTDANIIRSLTDAAVVNNSFNPEQVVAILRQNTQLAEELDAEGKPTGHFVPEVSFEDKDKEGKPVTLKLSPGDAVKRMSEMDQYLNLFKGDGTGGIGGTTRPGGKAPDIGDLAKDPEAYRKARAEGKIPQLKK